MLVLCPVCKVDSIDSNRNKRKKCKKCADKEKELSKRQKRVPHPMTFEDGCRTALHDSTNSAIHASSMIKCLPMKMHVVKYNKVKKNTTAHLLIHNDELNDITNEIELPRGERSKPLEIEFELPIESAIKLNYCENCDSPTNTIEFEDIANTVSSSPIPKVLNLLGPYSEVDDEVIGLLNKDFRLHPKVLQHIPKLFTGVLVHDKYTLIALTAEVYARHASLDIHLESGADSLPSSKCYYPNGLCCSVIASADGRGIMKKLIIGSRMMNMLITCSANITTGNALDTYVGPQVDLNTSQFTVEKTRIFLRREEMDRFKNMFQDSSSSLQIPVLEPTVSCLRQLSSSFDHISTYKPYRATLIDFEDTRFMPATVFTHCDTPNHDGYGALNTSCSKISSLLLQLIAIGLHNKTNLDQDSFENFFLTYDSANRNEDSESWKTLDAVVSDLKERCGEGEPINVPKYISQINLSKLANLVGSSLSKANEKIASNVKERLLNLYK